MLFLRKAAQVNAVRQRCADSELRSLLARYGAVLAEFGDDLQATILVVTAGDTLPQVEQTYGERLVADGRFTFNVELITRHDRWFDVVRIISDDGGGLVLLVEIAEGTDRELISACEYALAEATHR